MTTTETDRNRNGAGWAAAESSGSSFQWAVMLTAIAALGCFLFLAGGPAAHAGRAPLPHSLNLAAELSAGLMYGVTLLVVIFGIVVVGMSVAKPEK